MRKKNIRTIQSLLKESINPLEKRDAIEFLKVIHSNLSDIENKFYKNIVMMFFFILLFYFFSIASVLSVSLGTFKINDLKLIHKSIPLCVSYFYFNILSLISLREIIYPVFKYFFSKSIGYRDLSNIASFLYPNTSLLAGDILSSVISNSLSRYINLIKKVIGFILLILPLVFFDIFYYRALQIVSLSRFYFKSVHWAFHNLGLIWYTSFFPA